MDLTGITFDQTVPRALVDRGDATTVLITSWARSGDRLTAGAVWPRLGGYYRLRDEPTHDPLLVLETFRQAALLLAHVVHDADHGLDAFRGGAGRTQDHRRAD
jgi:hypothetical protein